MGERELFTLKITNLFPRGPDAVLVATFLRIPSSFPSLPLAQGFLSLLPLVKMPPLHGEVTVGSGTFRSSYKAPPLSDTNGKLS